MITFKNFQEKINIPTDLKLLLNEAIDNIKNDRDSQAFKIIRKCIKSLEIEYEEDQNNYDLIFGIGFCYSLLGEFQNSLKFLSKSIQVDKENLFYLLIRAELKLDNGFYQDSINDFSEYILKQKNKFKYLKHKKKCINLDSLNNRKTLYEFKNNQLRKETNYLFTRAFLGRGIAKRKFNDVLGAILDWSYAAENGNKIALDYIKKELIKNSLNLNNNEINKIKLKVREEEKSYLFSDAIISYNLIIDFYTLLDNSEDELRIYYYKRGLCKEIINDNQGALLDWTIAALKGDKNASTLLKEKRDNEKSFINRKKLYKNLDLKVNKFRIPIKDFDFIV